LEGGLVLDKDLPSSVGIKSHISLAKSQAKK